MSQASLEKSGSVGTASLAASQPLLATRTMGMGSSQIMTDAQRRAVNEEAVLARRREIEKDRRVRLTDKSYKYGIDGNALGAQVREKQESAMEEAAQDAAYDEMRLNIDKHLMYVDQQRDAYLRDRDQDLNEFRKNEQKKEDRREWDLNDPHAVRKDRPARLGDDDPNLSVSGMQKFAGEDLHAAERAKIQQAQLREWNARLAEAKRAKEMAEKATDDMWANHMLEADLMRCDYAEKEAEIFKQRQMETAEHNLAQAELRARLKKEADARSEIDALTEIQAQLNSGFLSEDPALTRSFVQPHRPRHDHFKGLTDAERQAILDERAKQVEERKRREQEEKDLEAKIADMTMHWNKVAMLQEHEVEQRRAQMRAELLNTHKEQATAKDAYYSHLYNEVYINQIDDDFFNRFGTSAR